MASSWVLSHVEGSEDGNWCRTQEKESLLGHYNNVRSVKFGVWFGVHAH